MTTIDSYEHRTPHPLVYAGLDEAGSLSANTPLFTMAVVISHQPHSLAQLIRRAARRSGKRLRRKRKNASELKWSNASHRIRSRVISSLSVSEADVYTLTVLKKGRRIKDTPDNYAILACELLKLCWEAHPNVVLSLDRHFTSPAHVATVNTLIHRYWPPQGVLSVSHVDSQRNPLVQLADFVAGSTYSYHKEGNFTIRLLSNNLNANIVDDWQSVKARWVTQNQ